MAKTVCVQDEGLHSRIPGSAVTLKSFVEAYHRLSGELDALQEGFFLEPEQLYATMAYYCANKEFFDAEYRRIIEERQRNLSEFLERNQDKNGWAEFKEPIRGDETDEEVNAILEQMS